MAFSAVNPVLCNHKENPWPASGAESLPDNSVSMNLIFCIFPAGRLVLVRFFSFLFFRHFIAVL